MASLSTLFDWTLLEQVAKVASEGKLPKESIQGSPCIAVGFSDWKARIPRSRARFVEEAIDEGIMELVQLPQPLHVGGVLRERQAFYGDVLVTVGGGPGVEHLSGVYRQMRQPVIPLDLPLKPGKQSASERLNAEAREKPSTFFEFESPGRAAAALSNLSLKEFPRIDDFTPRFLEFVTGLRAPQVFLAHLLNRKMADYEMVSAFIDQVVSEVMTSSGFSMFDPSKDASEELFLNVEVFEAIKSSSIVVVDLTGLRPNCFLELGFALGLGKKVIVTAADGTELPFDTHALPCHFWRPKIRNQPRRKAFEGFVAQNINRRRIN